MTVQTHAVPGEEATAAVRALLAMSLGVGAMAAGGSALTGDPLVLVGIPTLALAAAMVRAATIPAAYVAVALWLTFLPRVQGEAVLVPLAMAVICLAIALGPERLGTWLSRAHEADGSREADQGWIEEA